MASIISTKTSGGGGIAVTGDTSGVLELQSNNGTTAVTIDASQNVGIGTASPSSLGKFAVVGGNIVANGNGTIDPEFRLNGASGGVTRNYAMGTDASQRLYWYDYTASAYRMLIDSSGNLLFNSGYGSVATAYGCRAWVNFNGTGTVAIRASGNVSSITDNGTGIYTVNFTNAMPDANYSASIISTDGDFGAVRSGYTMVAGSLAISSRSHTGTLEDQAYLLVSVFR